MNRSTAADFFDRLMETATDREALFYALGQADALFDYAELPPEEAAALVKAWVAAHPNEEQARLLMRGMVYGGEASGIATIQRATISGGDGRLQ